MGGTRSSKKRRQAKTFLEFFSGIGLVREGLVPGGWECVFANDNDERKNAVYLDRFPEDGFLCREDVNNTDAILKRIPGQAVLATASFPCVDLSAAGKKKGLSGPDSSAFHGFVEVLRRLGRRKPRVVLLENVLGLLSSRGGRDFQIVTREIAELGYYLDAFLLNASHFTPQNRQRIFVVGVTKELRPGRVISGDGPLPCRPSELTTARLDKLIRETALPTGWVRFPLPSPPSMGKTLVEVVDLGENAKWWPDPKADKIFRQIPDNHRRILRDKLVSRTTWAGTIRTNHRTGRTWADLRLDGLAGAILTPRAAGGRQILVVTKDGRLLMRWLTAKEYARLQGSS
jgi:DNA (cytosine-5)-methyltransferase 1